MNIAHVQVRMIILESMVGVYLVGSSRGFHFGANSSWVVGATGLAIVRKLAIWLFAQSVVEIFAVSHVLVGWYRVLVRGWSKL